MLDTQVTVVGNVVTDPRLNLTKDNQAFTTFRIASTPRRFDRGTGEWRDGQTLFLGVTCWRGLAENTATCLKKGQTVIVVGRLSERSWETRDGEKRSSCEIDAAAIGPDLGRAVAFVKRAERSISAASGDSSPTDDTARGPAAIGDDGLVGRSDDDVAPIDWELSEAEPEPELESGPGPEPAGAPPAEEIPIDVVGESPVLVGAGARSRGRSGGS